MKILKVYDKINRNVFHFDPNTGNIIVREFKSDKDYFTVLINTKLFQKKLERVAFISCEKTINSIVRSVLDITSKHFFFKIFNKKGMLIHSERVHLKDNKSILSIDRIYDEVDEFIEIENHRGVKTVKFKIRNQLINNFLNIKQNGN